MKQPEGKSEMVISRLAYFSCCKVLRKCCQRPMLTLIVSSVLSLFIYIYCTNYMFRGSQKDLAIQDNYGLAYQLISNNGSFISESMPDLNSLEDDKKDELIRELRKSLNQFAAHCHEESYRCTKTHQTGSPSLLTLFTTFVYDVEKLFVNNNTLFNWKNLPSVNLVVFTNCSKVQYYSQLAKWHVMPVLHEAANAPILPDMFKSVMETFDSHFYGYANADLLFTGNLVSTLETILCEVDLSNSVLLVGKRTNIPVSFMTQEAAVSDEYLTKSAQLYGKLFTSDAEDYFITTKDFPWKGFLPLAIGRRGYDNWMVTFCRRNSIPVIDLTSSVLCVHQTLEQRGNYEGLTKGDYNLEILDGLNLPFKWAYWGQTICAGMRSFVNLCGDIEIEWRKHLDDGCTKYHLSHRIWSALGLS